MAKYFPKNKIIKGLYTKGLEYMDPAGIEYIGPYFIADNQPYSGFGPGDEQVALLIYKDPDNTNIPKQKTSLYDSLPKSTDVRNINYPNVFKPTPIDDDYQNTFIKRYFITKKNDPSLIIEVSAEEYSRIQGGNLNQFYSGISLDWKISGPKEDRINTNGLEELGVVNTNYRMLTLMEDDMPGISRRLQNLLDLSIYPGFVSYNFVHNSLQ